MKITHYSVASSVGPYGRYSDVFLKNIYISKGRSKYIWGHVLIYSRFCYTIQKSHILSIHILKIYIEKLTFSFLDTDMNFRTERMGISFPLVYHFLETAKPKFLQKFSTLTDQTISCLHRVLPFSYLGTVK